MSKEIRVVAIVRAKPGREAEVAAALKACVAPTVAEDGCKFYVPHVDLDDPTRFVFVERWTSRDALDAHLQTPHLKILGEALGPITEGKTEIIVVEELA